MAKGEINHYELFLFLSHCFQKLSDAEASGSVYMRERHCNFTLSRKNKFAAEDLQANLTKYCKSLEMKVYFLNRKHCGKKVKLLFLSQIYF